MQQTTSILVLYFIRIFFLSFAIFILPFVRYDLQASYKATWNTELCITKKTLQENVTRCICPLSGTYVILMSKRNYNVSIFIFCMQCSLYLLFYLTFIKLQILNFNYEVFHYQSRYSNVNTI